MRHARSIPMECVVVTNPGAADGVGNVAASAAAAADDNCEGVDCLSDRKAMGDASTRALVRPAVLQARDGLRYEWEEHRCPIPAAPPSTEDATGSDVAASTTTDSAAADGACGNDAVPRTGAHTDDGDLPAANGDVDGLDVSTVSAGSHDGDAAAVRAMEVVVEAGGSEEASLADVSGSMFVGQGGAVRVAAKLRGSGSGKHPASSAATAHPMTTTLTRTAPKRNTIAASTKGVHWSLLDAWTEQSIFAGVPDEALKPLVKPLRSEKATMLLEGYLSAADKRALRSTQGPNATGASPDDNEGRTAERTPFATASDDNDDTADPLQSFYAAEDALERRRFVGERWLDKITLFRSLTAWQRLLHAHYRQKPTSDVLTDAVRFGLRRWRSRARQSALVRSTECKKPPAVILKKTCAVLADWPLACVEALLAAGRPAVYAAGDAVFHEGDATEDVYVVCDGEVRAAVMRGERSRRRCFAGPYASAMMRQKEGLQPETSGVRVAVLSKRRLNHVASSNDVAVVGYMLHGALFGLDALLTKEPRCYTAWCTQPTCLLRIRRADVYLAMTPVPVLTRDVMLDTAWRERHRYVFGNAFPVPVDVLVVASPVFEHWHTSALQSLMSRATIRVFYKGDVLCTQGEVAAVGAAEMYLVLHGSLERAIAGCGAVRMGPLDTVGEEEGILCAFPCRETVRALETTQVLTIRQEDYLAVVREHGDCGSYARRAICSRMAARLVKPTNCPEALLHDPLMRFLLPDHILKKLWREHAEPVFLLQGDGVFRTWDEAQYIYLVVSGTLFQQYGAEGPQIPVVNLGVLSSGAAGDDAVHHAQADMQDEDELYNAMNSPGAYIKGGHRGPKAGGGAQPLAGTSGSCVHGSTSGSGGPHIWVPLERNLVATEEPLGGIVVGAVELALQRSHCLSHLRTTSNVVAWRWRRQHVEAMLRKEHPAVWTAICLEQTKDVVQHHFLGMSLRQLKDEAAPRSAELC